MTDYAALAAAIIRFMDYLKFRAELRAARRHSHLPRIQGKESDGAAA